MPWIRFTADMDWKPRAPATIAYKTGMVKNVTTACAAAAVRRGKGVRVRKTHRDAEPVDADQGQD